MSARRAGDLEQGDDQRRDRGTTLRGALAGYWRRSGHAPARILSWLSDETAWTPAFRVVDGVLAGDRGGGIVGAVPGRFRTAVYGDPRASCVDVVLGTGAVLRFRRPQ